MYVLSADTNARCWSSYSVCNTLTSTLALATLVVYRSAQLKLSLNVTYKTTRYAPLNAFLNIEINILIREYLL
jgi:hypothetical protein